MGSIVNKEIVKIILERCLGCKKGETLLIVCDDEKENLGLEFYKKAKVLEIESVLLEMPCRTMHGEEPPGAVASALRAADAAVLLTTMSLSHTRARKIASSRFGTRIASLPGITEEVLNRSILVDYPSLHNRASKISQKLTKGERIEIQTKAGTYLVMSVKGRKGFADDGLYKKSGGFGNLPAGESCIGPLEGTTNGRLIVDGSAPFVGKLKKPIEITVKDGYAQGIPVGKIASMIKPIGRESYAVAEFGIGLNPNAKVTGNVLEDEKAEKTAHIAFGNNMSFGGKISCPVHLDFVFYKPIVIIDGVKLDI